ncbi:MAG: GNAT family N-acetyltransferase [Armatimonadota bacterium]
MEVQPRPTIKGIRLTLRPPVESDKRDRLTYGRDLEFRRMVGGDPSTNPPLTSEEVDAWYKRMADNPLYWIIEAEGQCLGTVHLNLDMENFRARYSIGIYSPDYRGRGYGTEATQLMLRYAFDELKLHRVDLRVLDFNDRAIACYEKCGFVCEGIEREGSLIGGKWCTDIIMSILDHEYRQVI